MKNIFVTKPSLPPLSEFIPYMEDIWDSKWLTNNGKFHQELEKTLSEYLGVKYLSLFSNGTIALIVAIKALELTGEVITTPFSFVATTHSIWWNGIKPVFVDIEPHSYNLDPDKIEEAITPYTSAILPVHVYGNPCNVNHIDKIARKYNLKVLYDSAHAFGVKLNGKSVLIHGDLSVLSFHATKVFNTFEGGAIICHSKEMKRKIDNLKNFGIIDEETVIEPGINGKMNEIQAAFGLLQLKYVDEEISKRNKIDVLYRKLLENTKGITLLKIDPNLKYNYSYFPILIDPEGYGITRDEVYNKLKSHNIYSRKYFYPLISKFQIYNSLPSAGSANLPVAETISSQILCLPIFPDLKSGNIEEISNLIKEKFNNA